MWIHSQTIEICFKKKHHPTGFLFPSHWCFVSAKNSWRLPDFSPFTIWIPKKNPRLPKPKAPTFGRPPVQAFRVLFSQGARGAASGPGLKEKAQHGTLERSGKAFSIVFAVGRCWEQKNGASFKVICWIQYPLSKTWVTNLENHHEPPPTAPKTALKTAQQHKLDKPWPQVSLLWYYDN